MLQICNFQVLRYSTLLAVRSEQLQVWCWFYNSEIVRRSFTHSEEEENPKGAAPK